MISSRLIKRLIKTAHWLLLAVIILYAVTGYGITEYRTVETMTFGLLTKNLAFKIHDSLFIPLAVLLILHVGVSYFRFNKNKGPS